MKKIKDRFFMKFAGSLASLALMLTVFNANSACVFFYHQPELPKEAQSLRKF